MGGAREEKNRVRFKASRVRLLFDDVYVRPRDCVSGWDALIIVNRFSLASCSESWGAKRRRKRES